VGGRLNSSDVWIAVPSSTHELFHGATKADQCFNTFYSGGGWGGWGWGGGGMATTTVNTVKVGTGVVDIFDAKTKKLISCGTAQDEIASKAAKNEKKIEKATEKMFKDFPPTPKAG
jgi:hypothetical protein